MYVTLVRVYVTPDNIANFIKATQVNHEASIQEKGYRHPGSLQSSDDPIRTV